MRKFCTNFLIKRFRLLNIYKDIKKLFLHPQGSAEAFIATQANITTKNVNFISDCFY